ncbi:LOW QUALITY PROTEIN: uncharacterized protein [Henckelia pumila]|uniref:LOW QUALITY PROTEIN: uncharacterized protein n=1 Tax=Henckelia pumila TaxID=405737 RepID=UPI003C6EA16C
MADGKDKSVDFYAVLGLSKECTTTELRNEYKKLAMKWHPDRCCSNSNINLDEAKKKFQAIQQAYSVLSNSDKRFLYDVGFYDSHDDEDEKGMGEFLDEMASMMSQNKSDGNESLEELQQLFNEMFVDSHHNSSTNSETNSSSTELATFCMGVDTNLTTIQ